ncbi:hypothetical protein BOX15_Mlig026020g4, partial [Macrostomum lignano]
QMLASIAFRFSAGSRLCVACRLLSTSPCESQIRGQVLDEALARVPDLGWTRSCVEAGARTLDLPETMADLAAPRGGADLALYFIDSCNDKLEAQLKLRSSGLSSAGEISLELVGFACRERLSMIRPLLPYWPAGIATLTGSPSLALESAARLQRLADDICHYAGDRSTDLGWYARRLAVGAVYASTEAFMLQDVSEDLVNTWAFLDRRINKDLAAIRTARQVAGGAFDVAANMLGLARR